jgi:hypothetical protein
MCLLLKAWPHIFFFIDDISSHRKITNYHPLHINQFMIKRKRFKRMKKKINKSGDKIKKMCINIFMNDLSTNAGDLWKETKERRNRNQNSLHTCNVSG